MPNHLTKESSLYLQQHANNPVDWYPWGPEALKKALQENKPILLSIGYSACHWCHVMAEESFVDEETAQLMNSLFVNIKVDREERPDLDKIYQTSHQILSGHGGGWPLTVFLTPQNQIPFFSGTYFPKEPRYGIVPFKALLLKISDFYRTNFDKISEQNIKLQQAFVQLQQIDPVERDQINETPFVQNRKILGGAFDPINGGFGAAPKFPQPMNLRRLLNYWLLSKTAKHEDKVALQMVVGSLEGMAKGGVYDQLGGGFYRYSVDGSWKIPHFEKMLYDNAQLIALYAQVFKVTQNPLFKRVLEETTAWVFREMQSPEGGFYSSIDADSEHHEGKFYYWDRKQIEELLTSKEYDLAEAYFGLDQEANFDHHWHLHLACPIDDLEKQLNLSTTEIETLLKNIKQKLFAIRENRVRPARDEKIITSWNALMIKGLAIASQALQRDDIFLAADAALKFIHKNLWKDSRLFATFQKGKTKGEAFLDDYAFLLDAIITMLEVHWQTEYLNFAMALAEKLLNQFEDKKHGGFYFTANDHESLIDRPKTWMDEAIPAGNGVAALALQRLGYLLGEQRYLEAAAKTLQATWSTMEHYSGAQNSLLDAAQEYLFPPEIIIIRGEGNELLEWKNIATHELANRLVFAIPDDVKLPKNLVDYKSKKNKTIAYICKGLQCFEPMETRESFIEHFDYKL